MTDPATALREYAGVIADDYQPCFSKELLNRMFSNPPVTIGYTPKYIFIAVDPNGGGISQLGVCSGYYDEHLNFVVSLFYIIIRMVPSDILFLPNHQNY